MVNGINLDLLLSISLAILINSRYCRCLWFWSWCKICRGDNWMWRGSQYRRNGYWYQSFPPSCHLHSNTDKTDDTVYIYGSDCDVVCAEEITELVEDSDTVIMTYGINPILLTVSLRSAVSTDGVHWRCPVNRGVVAQPCLALGAPPTFPQTALRWQLGSIQDSFALQKSDCNLYVAFLFVFCLWKEPM